MNRVESLLHKGREISVYAAEAQPLYSAGQWIVKIAYPDGSTRTMKDSHPTVPALISHYKGLIDTAML